MKPPTGLAFRHAQAAIVAQLPSALAIRRHARALGFHAGPPAEPKRSNTLFVLGTGPSIADLDPSNWQHIATHDSLGINFFGLHRFVPTWLSQESITAGVDAKSRQAHRLEMLNAYGADRPVEIWRLYPGIRHELDDDEGFIGAPDRTGNSARVSTILHLAAHDETAFRRVAAGTNRSRRTLKAMYSRGLVPNFRSSVIWAVWLARQAEYGEVVLCGVDLQGHGHFWDRDPTLLRGGLASWPSPTGKVTVPHTTESGAVSTSAGLVTMAEVFTASRGPRLSLGTANSRLSGRIPNYSWL